MPVACDEERRPAIAHHLMWFVLIPRQPGNRFRAAAGIPSFRSKANSTDKKGIAPRGEIVSRTRVHGLIRACRCYNRSAIFGDTTGTGDARPSPHARENATRVARLAQTHARTRQLSLLRIVSHSVSPFFTTFLENVLRYCSMCAHICPI